LAAPETFQTCPKKEGFVGGDPKAARLKQMQARESEDKHGTAEQGGFGIQTKGWQDHES